MNKSKAQKLLEFPTYSVLPQSFKRFVHLEKPEHQLFFDCKFTDWSSLQNIDTKIDTTDSVDNSIEDVLNDTIQKNFTHYICLPIESQALCVSYNQFHKIFKGKYEKLSTLLKEDVTSGFQNPNNLHATLLLLNLPTAEDIEKTIKILNSLNKRIYSIIENKPLCLNFKGVDIMGEDSSSTRLLVTKPLADDVSTIDKINRITQVFIDELKKNNLLTLETLLQQHVLECDEKTVSVPLHVTLYRFKGQKKVFDANKLLNHFIHFDFGHVYFNQIYLCARGISGNLKNSVAAQINLYY